MAKRITKKPVDVSETTRVGLSVKVLISLIAGIIFYTLLLAGGYYALTTRITLLENKTSEVNLQVLNYKVDAIIKAIEELKK